MTVLVEKGRASFTQPNNGISCVSDPVGFPVSFESKLTILLISLLVLVTLLAQFVLRDVDNNRLLSWHWVMGQSDILKILLVSFVGMVAVYKSCFLHFPVKREILYLVVASYIMGMVTWSAPEFMVDSGRYFTHAKLIATHGIGYFLSEWGYGINAWTDLPLASVIYGAAFYVFGESRLPIQIINTGLFSGSIFLTYLIGKELWDDKTGIIAAWMLLAIPFMHVQVSQMLVDVPAMFFTATAIWLSILAIKRAGNGWVLLASASIVFALLTKYSAWIALTPIAVLPFALKECDRTTAGKRLLLLALVTSVLLIFVFYVHHPVLLKQLKILLDYQLPALQRWQESYTSTFFYQVHPFVSIAALASVYFAIKKKELVFLIPAIALFLMLMMEVYRARYLIIVFPMLAMVAAFGVRQIRDIAVQRFVVRSAVVVSLAVTLIANLNFLQSTSSVNLKDAGQYLDKAKVEDVSAIVLPQMETAVNPVITLPLIDYYMDKSIRRYDIGGLSGLLSEEHKAVSPLRFTWEVDSYPYDVIDLKTNAQSTVIILITGSATQALPTDVQKLLANHIKIRSFAVVDSVFRFQSVVTVYRLDTGELWPTLREKGA